MPARVLITGLRQANPGELIRIDSDQSRYLLQVRRLKPGEPIELFDGDGFSAASVLEKTEKRIAVVRRPTELVEQPEPQLRVRLIQCLARNDRMDWVIEKATELGVARITPASSTQSVVRLNEHRASSRQQHWQRVAAAACRQCGQNRLPRIDLPIELPAALAGLDADGCRIVMDPEGESLLNIVAATTVTNSVTLLVGPESGLTPEELSAAKRHDFAAGRLGPRILRTETAAVAAISIVQAAVGEFVQSSGIG